MKIIFYDTKPYDRIYFDKFFAKSGHNAVYIEEKLNLATVKLAEGADAVCIFVNDSAGEEIVDALYNLKVGLILLRCAG